MKPPVIGTRILLRSERILRNAHGFRHMFKLYFQHSAKNSQCNSDKSFEFTPFAFSNVDSPRGTKNKGKKNPFVPFKSSSSAILHESFLDQPQLVEVTCELAEHSARQGN